MLRWIENMKWKKLDDWKMSVRSPLVVNGIIEGYVKRTDNFAFYWINRAGHMVFNSFITSNWRASRFLLSLISSETLQDLILLVTLPEANDMSKLFCSPHFQNSAITLKQKFRYTNYIFWKFSKDLLDSRHAIAKDYRSTWTYLTHLTTAKRASNRL